MASSGKTKVGLKFQIRVETPRGWEQLTDEEKSRVYSALMDACHRVGVADTRNMYGPHWEESNISKSLVECCWEITIPVSIV